MQNPGIPENHIFHAMQKNTRFSAAARLAFTVAAAISIPLLAGCALSGAKGGNAAAVDVASSDRLLLTVAAFDPVVAAELARGGLDPARVAEDLDAELRYRLALRKQEEALDSAGATVRLRVQVLHLQPGTGNAGNFAAVRLVALRGADSTVSAWDWRPPARENVGGAHVERHLVRGLAGEVVARLKPGRKKNYPPGLDTPPPLILLQ